jgi:hypothetical protein
MSRATSAEFNGIVKNENKHGDTEKNRYKIHDTRYMIQDT